MRWFSVFALVALAAAKPQVDDRQRPDDRQLGSTPPKPAPKWLPMPGDDHFEYRNPDFTDDGLELFESDILLTEEQRRSINDRQAATNLWTSPVKFAITNSSEPDREGIERGIQHWRDNSCLQFEEVPEGSSEKHMAFVKGSGCWAHLGKTSSPRPQKVNIGPGCAGLFIVTHEIGHALGVDHQQSRSDRDTYVTIGLENIRPGKEGNFRLARHSLNHSVPYDLTSIMHYGSRWFSKNKKNTIYVKEFWRANLIDGKKVLTHRDKHLVSMMYRCAASCSNPPTCQNGGYVKSDCTCACPHNTAGSNCETLNGGYYPDIDCGDLNINSEGTITSPNYPNKFPKNVVCWWLITAGEGQTVKVSFTDMKVLYRYKGVKCLWDYISLRYSGSDHIDDQKACDEELKGKSFTSTGNRFIVKFQSGNYGWYRGFSANVKFLN